MPVIATRNPLRERPLTDFASDSDAYEYARENRACVYDPATMCCVYCCRADH
jgi:hypothetical protein